MKKFRIFFPLVALILLAACNNDPKMMILANPVAPVLSTPSHSTTAYIKDSLAYILNMDSTGLADTFMGTSANYGVGTTVTYSLQIDKTGDNFANAQTITTATKDTFAVSVLQLYTVVTNATLNATVGVQTSFDVRVKTTIGTSLQPTYTNVLTLMIDPLPALKPFSMVPTINLWYIIGLGDGTWTYSAAGIGVSMFPLSLVSSNAYDNSGDGTFTYTGYFQHIHGFKIVSGKASDMGTWSVQWGSSDGVLTPEFEIGSSQNFTVPADGYYTITLNSIANTLSIVPTITASIPATSYATMDLSGDWNAWSGTANPMSGFGTTNNHQWYATVTLPASSAPGIKFNYNSWANSWGSVSFPYGFGISNGSNIPYTSGTYTVCFNDIDDCYYFIKQ
jgi:hypothetical protein